MGFNIFDYCRDMGIDYRTEGHKHCQEGWVQMRCPFCAGNPGWHLGFSLSGDYFNCWRCGFHPITRVIEKIQHVFFTEAKKIAAQYGTRVSLTFEKKVERGAKDLRFPPGTGPLSRREVLYLRSRGFPAARIINEWNLLATGPVGKYKFRIIAPITYNNQLVSFQGRDITDKSDLKYKACLKQKEVIHHKRILYGMDKLKGESAILVEGITDAWKLGPGAISGFGIKMKYSQIRLMAENLRRVFILFDEGQDDIEDEVQADEEAEKIGNDLSLLGVKVERIYDIGADDPGKLPFGKARKLKEKILGKIYS